jgi:DNA segregation ATPase FtsK/SpoIIIE-like protein
MTKKNEMSNTEIAKGMIEIFRELFISSVKLPWVMVKAITQVDKIKEQKAEIERLKRVVESKTKAREKMLMNGNVLHWDNKYLNKDGIFSIGMDLEGNLIIVDFNKFANLLVGGEPGGGKTKLMQLLAWQCLKNNAKVYIADFKGLDFRRFENKCEVIFTHNHLLEVMKKLRAEIERRKKLFNEVDAENLKDYNEITKSNMTRQYLIIDELGEAMEVLDIDLTKKERKEIKEEIELYCKSLARLGRAYGINLIFGTQRPDVGVLEGQTRDMFAKRICFKAINNTSRIVLDSTIAQDLPDIPGRAIIRERTQYIEMQVFKFEKDMIKEIQNRKLNKEDLKVVNLGKGNTITKKDVETIDFDID